MNIKLLFLMLVILIVNTHGDSSYIVPNMLKIKSGSFAMGSDNGYDFEKPVHMVVIKKDFYVSKYEVTFREYDKFCEDTGKTKPYDNGWGRDYMPVINISWNDAKEYILWLSQKTNKKYRLLTEAEWEYVARANTNTEYSFGNNENDLSDYAWYDENSYIVGVNHKDYGTHPVGTKLPNSFGIYDMHGNVWEWCEDWFANNYNSTPRDGGSYNKKERYKVIRGGSWNFNAFRLRSSVRGRADINNRAHDIGFRIAQEL